MPGSKSVTSFAHVQTIAVGLLGATVVYAIVGTVLVLMRVIPEKGLTEMPDDTALIVKAVLLAVGMGGAAASFALRRVLDGQVPSGEEGFPFRFRNLIVAMALGESAGVMGLVVALVTGDAMFSILLWGAAIAACILHFPTRAGFGVSA